MTNESQIPDTDKAGQEEEARAKQIAEMREKILANRRRQEDEKPIDPETFLMTGEYGVSQNPEKMKKALEQVKKYTAGLDLISICYHGIGRSQQLLFEIQDTQQGENLQGTHIGISQQIDKLIRLNSKFLYTLSGELSPKIISFLDDLADTITEAKRVVLFDQEGTLNNDLERRLYKLIIEKAKAKGRVVFDLSSSAPKSGYVDLFRDLGLA